MSLADALNQGTISSFQESGIWNQVSLGNALRPVLLICETINVCNSLCVFCPYSKQSRPKGLMSLELFEKVVQDYRAMGGGVLSLTPMVGDVLLDRKLIERLDILVRYKQEITPSITTNLFALDRYSDDDIFKILDCFARVHVSCYGVSAAESEQITKTQQYSNFISNMQRLTALWQATKRKCDLRLGFRLLDEPGENQLDNFLADNFGYVFPYTYTARYANWGNSMSNPLPGKAEWLDGVENSETCILLLTAVQVYWDGRVSACACCDYDSSHELFLGDVGKESLIDIFNGHLSQQVWLQHEKGNLPDICKECTFHRPLTTLDKHHALIHYPLDFIGG